MALIDCNFHSYVLNTKVNVRVVIPTLFDMNKYEKTLDEVYPIKKFKTLYLLHGMFDDYSCWTRHSNVERYAEEKDLALVMTSVQNSFYVDTEYGHNYYTFITEELPRFVRMTFPLSDKKEDNFIGGLSMGGYGALMIALRNPDKFAAAVCLSGAVDVLESVDFSKEPPFIKLKAMFGENPEKVNPYKIYSLIENLTKSGLKLPRIYQAIGREDFLYESNIRFKKYLEEKGIAFAYEEGPGGHEWDFWDTYIKKAIEWLNL